MAVSVISPVNGLFDPKTRDKSNVGEVLKLALFGKPQFPKGTALSTQDGDTVAADILRIQKEVRTAKVMLANLMGRRGADFSGTFDTSNADALASAFSLTGKGVTFPAATLRTIRLRMVSTNNADSFYQEVEQDVWGNDGVTPVLGDARLVKAFMVDAGVYQQMGRAHLKTTEAGVESTDGMNSTGLSVAGLTAGTGVLTTPVARAVKVIGAHYGLTGAYDAGATGIEPHIQAFDGDGSARIDMARPDTGAVSTAPAAGFLDVELELWPISQCQLVLNSTAVEVHIRTTVADIFRHKLEAYIGPAITNTLSA
jgi:hypothetical protein